MITPLKKERLKRCLGTEELAAAVGVSQPTINRVENGIRRASPDLADRLQRYFGLSITRDQILYPEYYEETPRRSVQPATELQEVA
jgi:transcriptional regulator with XRE-family HTH domain